MNDPQLLDRAQKQSVSIASELEATALTTAPTTSTNHSKQQQLAAPVDSLSSSSMTSLSFFYSLMPKQILGVPVSEIKKDLSESTSQIASMLVMALLFIDPFKRFEIKRYSSVTIAH
jgi:hypothetical protein